MKRDRLRLIVVAFALAVGGAASCTSSEPVDTSTMTGAAGSSTSSGGAGTTGAAGSSTGTTGSAGTSAGTTGSAGSSAGTTGAAGTGTGTTGAGGAGVGTTGAAGTGSGAGGTAGAGAAGTGAAGASGAAGAGGSGSAGAGGTTLSYKTDIEPIVQTRCTPCHITNSDGGMSLKMGAGFMNLVNVNASTTACTLLDATKKRVIPGNPDKSMVWIKLSQTGAALNTAKCGAMMPKNPTGLTDTEKTKIHDWIMGGANM